MASEEGMPERGGAASSPSVDCLNSPDDGEDDGEDDDEAVPVLYSTLGTTAPEQPVLHVGFVANAKKQRSLRFRTLASALAARGVAVTLLDPDETGGNLLSDQAAASAPVDVLVVKASHEIAATSFPRWRGGEGGDPDGPLIGWEAARRRLEALEAYQAAIDGRVPVLYPTHAVLPLADRAAMCELLERVVLPDRVFSPRWWPEWPETAVNADGERPGNRGARLPLMAKPRQAFGGLAAHCVELAWAAVGGEAVEGGLIYQERVEVDADDAGLVYKAYVCGDALHVVVRRGPEGELIAVVGPPDPDVLASTDDALAESDRVRGRVWAVFDRVAATADALGQALGMLLFGFDVLVEAGSEKGDDQSSDRRLAVIDVNYFPTFRDIPSFHDDFCDLLLATGGVGP